MKITIGNFSLADGGDASPEDLRVSGSYQVQTGQFLRGAAVSLFPRGNQANTVTFGCTREHASYAAAQAFLFAHAATMPVSGRVTFTSEDWEGGVTAYTAVAAAISGREGSQTGITTRHLYTILCGALSGGSLAL